MLKKRIALVLSVTFVLVLISGIALAIEKPKDYPKRSIEFVVAYGPGGGSDVFTRTIAIPARKSLRGLPPIVIVNKPGAGGATAMQYVQSQPADGYTIFSGSTVVTSTGNLGGLSKYTYTDWRQIMRAQHDTETITVKGTGGKYKNIEELVADARARPGQVTIGVVGRKEFWYTVLGQWTDPLGLKFKIINWQRAGKATAALLGGHLDAIIDEPATMMSLIKAKKLKVVLTFTEKPLDFFSGVPSTKDVGEEAYLSVFRGLAAKKGTPEPIVKYIHDVFKKAYDSDYYQTYQEWALLHLRKGYLNSDDSQKFHKDQYDILYCEYKKRGFLDGNERIKPDCK